MKSAPLISVIITNYNYGSYVAESIHSVLNQTYKKIELIIINDGSKDNSDEVIRSIISKYKNSNIKYINRSNKGIVYTRNEGIKVASGKYITYLDADDYFNKDYIAESYKIAKKYNADVVYPNWHFVGDWLGRPNTDFPEFEKKLLQLQLLHCTPASLIKKAAIKNHLFEIEKVAEDWDFFIGLSLDGAKFKLAKNNYINYRIKKGSRGTINSPRDDTKVFVEILNKYKLKYGDQVIDPKLLVKERHPSIFYKILHHKHLRLGVESLKKHGLKKTTIKILSAMYRNKLVNKIFGIYINITNNASYRKLKYEYSTKTDLAIIVHLYYKDSWALISKKLEKVNHPFDLYLTVPENNREMIVKRINKFHRNTKIITIKNRGRDVLPFMQLVSRIGDKYQYFLKVHSKKSLHRSDGNIWLESMLDQLVPSDCSGIIKILKKNNTGLIGPEDHVVSLLKYMGGNKEKIQHIMKFITTRKMTIKILNHPEYYPFFGGTMFWGRFDFILPLINNGINAKDFNHEKGQLDGTTAHAIERLLGGILHTIENKRMYSTKNGEVVLLTRKKYESEYNHVG
jgi:glycosyltransferase involved in cell wall biosynthesis